MGTRTFSQLEENVKALSVQFTADQIARLQAVSRIDACFPNNLIDTPTSEMMFGQVKIAKRR